MYRRQLILFSVLLIITVTLLAQYEHVKLTLSTRLSSVLLFPIEKITELTQYLSVSNERITELEIQVNQLLFENTELRKQVIRDTIELTLADYRVFKAQVIGRDPSNINGYLYINMGKNQNLHINQPVVSVKGLIGKVKHVGNKCSIIETIENHGFSVSALDINTGVHGIVKQNGHLIFDYIRIDDPIYCGDSIYTSGMSEIFPEGILIGIVKHVGVKKDQFFKHIYITPTAQINRLTRVYIVSRREPPELEKVEEFNNFRNNTYMSTEK